MSKALVQTTLKLGTKRATNPTEEEQPAKRTKLFEKPEATSTLYPWTNRTIPESLSFNPPGDKIRISAWNVCGLTACWKKGFGRYVEAEDADILVLTETKVSDRPLDRLLTSKYPHQYWNIAAKKGYAGTAMLSKHKPLSASFTLDHSVNAKVGAPELAEDDVKGRLVTLEFESCWVIGTYVPNAGDNLKNMDRKVAWQVAFEAHVRKLDAIKPVIWAGDMNVAPTAMDIKNAKSNWNKTAGYTEIETSAFKQMLAGPPAPSLTKDVNVTGHATETHIATATPDKTTDLDEVTASVAITEPPKPAEGQAGPMIDVWRKMHPKDQYYTYFSYRFQARLKGIGWRLDHYVVSERFFSKVAVCEIRNEIWGASDHCPVIMDFEGPL